MFNLVLIHAVTYTNINEALIPLFDDEPTRIASFTTDIDRLEFLRELLPVGSSYRVVLENALHNW